MYIYARLCKFGIENGKGINEASLSWIQCGETTMNSTMKKLLYIPWVLFLFGIAAILTLFDLVFQKGRSVFAFNNNGAWTTSQSLKGKKSPNREVSDDKQKYSGSKKDEKLFEMRPPLSLEAQVQQVVWELFTAKRRYQLWRLCSGRGGYIKKALDTLKNSPL